MGYMIDGPAEAEKMLRTISLYAGIGLTCAETAAQKQFILERIIAELGMSIADYREKFGALPGEPFDISNFLTAWEAAEAHRYGE